MNTQTPNVNVVPVVKPSTTTTIRFEVVSAKSDKSPLASYYISAGGYRPGTCDKGNIFPGKDGSKYSVSIPGGVAFGGVIQAEMEVFTAPNGRKIAVSGSFSSEGEAFIKNFSGVVLTAYLNFLKDPIAGMIQTVTF